jgi:peptidoglycan hydrolase-like protein with peptidoglycan-binding domain
VEAQPTTPAPKATGADVQSLQIVEALLGRSQRRVIQKLLKEKGLYQGPIDAIFGDRTRSAIRAFQKQSGAEETGYLTPAQFKRLVEKK